MDKITVSTVARKMGVSPQAVYKWLDGTEPTPANLSQALYEAGNRLLESAKINETRAIEYQELARHIDEQEQDA